MTATEYDGTGNIPSDQCETPASDYYQAPSDKASRIADALRGRTSQYGQGVELTSSGQLVAGPDQMAALGGWVGREYGDYGYVFEYLHSITGAVTLAQVRHFDGSRFIVAADKWGQVRRVDNASVETLAADIAAMHEAAVTP